MSTKLELQFSDLIEDDQKFIVDWVQKNFVAIARIPLIGTTEVSFLAEPFSRMFFRVTDAQFTEAMRRAGFLVAMQGEYIHFNVGKRSPAYEVLKL